AGSSAAGEIYLTQVSEKAVVSLMMIGKSRSNDHRIRLLLTTFQPGSSPDVLYQKQHDFRSDENRWGRAFAHGRARLRPGRGQLAAFGGRNRTIGLSQGG